MSLTPFPNETLTGSRRFDLAALIPTVGLEEVCVADAAGMAAGLAFITARQTMKDAGSGKDARLVAVAAPRFWLAERGQPYLQGLKRLGVERLLVATPRNEAEVLWALEEVLRSGVADLAIGAVENASLVATRRLDMIACGARVMAGLIRTTPSRNLSAARRRWRLAPAPSAPNPWDDKASGRSRWRAALERSRDGAFGEALLEFDDETLRLRLVDGLADHSLALDADRSSRVA